MNTSCFDVRYAPYPDLVFQPRRSAPTSPQAARPTPPRTRPSSISFSVGTASSVHISTPSSSSTSPSSKGDLDGHSSKRSSGSRHSLKHPSPSNTASHLAALTEQDDSQLFSTHSNGSLAEPTTLTAFLRGSAVSVGGGCSLEGDRCILGIE